MNNTINTEVIETNKGSLTLTFEEDKGLYYTRIVLVAPDGNMRMVKKDGAYWRDHAAEKFGASLRIARRMEVPPPSDAFICKNCDGLYGGFDASSPDFCSEQCEIAHDAAMRDHGGV